MKKKEYKVIVASDLHYLSSELMDDGKLLYEMMEVSDGRRTDLGECLIQKFIADMQQQHPDALILAGDLTFNGEKASHEQLARFLTLLSAEKIPVLVLPGNHDLDNCMAGAYIGDEGYSVPTICLSDFLQLYAPMKMSGLTIKNMEEVQYHEAGTCAVREAAFDYIYALDPKLWILCVDVNEKKSPGKLSSETLKWVEVQLVEAKKSGARVIGVSHQNLLIHNSLISEGYVMTNAEKLLDLYQKYGVQLHLSGHMHVQHWKEEKGITEIVTSSLSIPPFQYGLLEFSEAGYCYRTKKLEMEEDASKAYCELQKKQYLKEITDMEGAHQEASGVRIYEQNEKLADGLARLNLAFFSGQLDMLPDREEIRKLWNTLLPHNFRNHYISSIFEEPLKSETRHEESWKTTD